MKKILLILLILFCTGCYDYNEINDLEIVSGIVIDYEDEEYIVNIEVLDTSESASQGSYYLNGKGKTVEEAMNNVYFGSASTPFYSHMKTLIVSERVAKRGIDDFFDFLLRDTKLRKDFYVFVSTDIDKILEYESEPKESLGELARMSAKRNLEDNGRYKTSTFRELITNYLRNNNYIIGGLEIEDEIITLDKTYLFIDNKIDMTIDKDAALLANMLSGENKNFQVYGDYSFEIHEYKLDRKVEKDRIVFSIEGQARLIDAREKNPLNQDDIAKMEKELNEGLEKAGKEIVEYAKSLNRDIFNFNHYYYLYFPNALEEDTWKNISYEFKANMSIGEKGLLLDSLGGANGK